MTAAQVYTWGGGGKAPSSGVNVDVMVSKFGDEWYRNPVRVDGGLHKPADAEQQWAARMIASAAAKDAVASASAGSGAVVEESPLSMDANVVDVAPGHEHCVAAIIEGGCFSWGQNIYGQTGRPKRLETSQLDPRVRRCFPMDVVRVCVCVSMV